MSRTLLIASLALVMLLRPAAAPGQVEADARPEVPVLAERLAGEKRARVLTQWGPFELIDPRLEGADAIGYRRAWLYGLYDPPQEFPTPLPLAEVSAVQVRQRATDTGALMGGAAVGAMGLLAGLTYMRPCATSGDLFAGCGFTPADVATTAAVSGATGALIGALYGSQLRRWKTVYRGRSPVRPQGISTRSLKSPNEKPGCGPPEIT